MTEFVHLHLHSQYSLLDGAIKIPDLLRRVAQWKMPAVAITDHGAMIGAVEFYEQAREAGIRPIMGVEAYVAPGSAAERRGGNGEERSYHLILLAESQEGYRNLIRLVSRAHREGFYYRPRVDKNMLREHAAGLVATSACLQGEIPQALESGGEERAAAVLEEYKALFPGRFYIEIQDNGLSAQARANERLIALARRTGTPLVATNDCHYLDKSDARVHEVLLCLQTGKTLSAPDRMRFESDGFYLKPAEEFERAFAHVAPDAIRNTVAIAERCRVELELGTPRIPEFPVPEGTTPEAYLRALSVEGLARRLEEKRARGERLSRDQEAAYRARLDYELEVIERTGFAGYFLVVWDFIRYAKTQGIPVGPGRGSAAGSLAAYCLGITEIDPLPYGLLFERFLNPDRISLPDMDCDFSKDRRDEVIQYVRERYGEENVCQILALGTMKARAAVRDVGRVLEMPYAEVDRLAKLIPAAPDMTLERALEIEPRLREAIAADPRVAELFHYARAIEGLSRHASTHAAGVVIASRPITEFVPLYRNATGTITTQFQMGDVEKVGLVKFDFLGLRTLTAIHNALALIRERTGRAISLEALPLDDRKTYEMLSRGDTAGVFQCESRGFTDLLVRLRPERFTHLVDAVAIFRPGPLQSGMVEDLIERRHGRRRIEYVLPELEPILRDTYGVILYQEQVMQIAVALAGFTMAEADVLRKAMGKKKPELIGQLRDRFLEGARARGIAPDKAGAVFDLMAQFAGYGFNKSHSAAYAVIAYQTAYLKAHFPVEYMCALMTSEAQDTEKIIWYINHCREAGIAIRPPDVNESRLGFHPVGDAIRFGLSAIKGVGESAVEAVLAAREAGPFESVDDFLSRVDLRRVNRRVVECLVKAGAFDSLEPDRGRLFARLPALFERAQEEARRREAGQFALFGEKSPAGTPRTSRPVAGAEEPLWSRKERLAHEKEALGFYITGHPLDAYTAEAELFANTTSADLAGLRPGSEARLAGIVTAVRERTTRRGGKMAYVTLEDLQGIVEVVVFQDTYRACAEVLASQEPVFVVGRVKGAAEGLAPEEEQEERLRPQIVAQEIFLMEQVRERLSRSVHFRLLLEGLTTQDVGDFRRILERHGGSKKGFLHLARPGEYEVVIALPDRVGVAPSFSLTRELRARFGYDVLDPRWT